MHNTQNKPQIVGRLNEIQVFDQIAASKEAEFLAVYGRRRVGKTFLIKEYFIPRSQLYFSVTGLKDGALHEQLQLYQEELEKVFFEGTRIPDITSWKEGLKLLSDLLVSAYRKNPESKLTVFLDELPWLTTPKSGLLQAIDHCWNTILKDIPTLRFIICGSAASWIIEHVLNDKGGLHNRVTRKMRLNPFTLAEANDFLKTRGVRLNPMHVLEIYMAMGGVAHYLKQVQKGLSAKQNISKICFSKDGFLRTEFENLFQSLFDSSENHIKIIHSLSSKKGGYSRTEIIKETGISSGGRLATWLNELEEAGFILSYVPFGKNKKDIHYRIIDEFTWFYLKWIKPMPKGEDIENYWEKISLSPSYLAWTGIAFEGICLKHRHAIESILKIDKVTLQASPWRYSPTRKSKTDQGAQIDLAFDRTDDAITLLEIKYSSGIFELTKAYAQELKQKLEVFQSKTRTKKQLFLVLLTTHGLKQSFWAEGLIDQVIKIDQLLVKGPHNS